MAALHRPVDRLLGPFLDERRARTLPGVQYVDHGTFRVDEYQGFHPDIFVHTDGHSVIGNQVFVSMLAAVPLWCSIPCSTHSSGIAARVRP